MDRWRLPETPEEKLIDVMRGYILRAHFQGPAYEDFSAGRIWVFFTINQLACAGGFSESAVRTVLQSAEAGNLMHVEEWANSATVRVRLIKQVGM